MSAIKLIIEDRTYEVEQDRVMLSEAVPLEREWGVKIADVFGEFGGGSPSSLAVGAMVWLVKVRALAAEEGIPFREAAARMPVADFDVNLAAIRADDTAAAGNPTGPATPTPGTRTTRATSGKARSKRS